MIYRLRYEWYGWEDQQLTKAEAIFLEVRAMNAPESGFESRVPPVATSAEQLLTGLQVAQSGHDESCTACGERAS